MLPPAVPDIFADKVELSGSTPLEGVEVKVTNRVSPPPPALTVIVLLSSAEGAVPRSTITLPVYVPSGVYEWLGIT